VTGAPGDAESAVWAFFDLDGTLIRRDSYLPFLWGWLCAHPGRAWRAACLPFACAWALARGRGRGGLKQAFLAAFMQGARREEVDAFAERFWERFLRHNENAEVVRRLRGHREEGHRVYIVTASFAFYTAHLARRWPVDGVIGTRAVWDGDLLAGRLDGANCRGEEKLRRIREELGVALPAVECYAYSDSDADRPLCESARYAFRVESSTIRPW